MRILLHIGTDKTGSTAIQQHIALNQEWLASHSVFLPLPELHGGNAQADALLNGFPPDRVSQLVKELAAAEQRGLQVAILSWEGMNYYSAAEIKQLGSILSGHELVVLVYLREQADIIQTGLLQQHKSLTARLTVAAVGSPTSLPERNRVQRFLRSATRDYSRLLRRWKQALPEARLLARIYDRELLVNHNVVDDFIEQLGLQVDHSFKRSSVDLNVSLDVESALLINRWQHSGLPADDMQRKVDIALSLIASEGGGSKYFLREEDVAFIRRHFRSSNKKLARYFPDGHSYLFPHERDCWRGGDYKTIVERVDQRDHRITQIDETPTLSPLKKGPDIPSKALLNKGWQGQEKWGVWSKGASSGIRFRVWQRQIKLNSIGIRVFIRGRYYGDNKSTRVEINGHSYGEQTLDRLHPGLVLPSDWLLPFEIVDIRLNHKHPVSPREFEGRPEDNRLIAFGVRAVGYLYLWEESA